VDQGWTTALLAATAAHAGFQATVTVLVYPALARLPDGGWARGHGAHTRAITPLVVVVYGALLVACAGAAVSALRSADAGVAAVAVWVSVAATAVVLVLTATLAGPTHSRLASGRTEALVHRLLLADRGRLVGALVALVAAAWAVVA
jgi:hypothetical protein